MRAAPLLVALALAVLVAAPARAADGLLVALHGVGAPRVVTYAPSGAALARQVASLQALGARFVTVSELRTALATDGLPLAAITFDDGDASVFTEAWPLLNALGVPATVFVITDRIDRPGSLTGAQLQTLHATGWEIGSHSAGHAALVDLTPTGVRGQLGDAIAALAALGLDAPCLSYPFGLHDARVRALAAEVHDCAVTVAPGRVTTASDPFALPRPASSWFDGGGIGWRAPRGVDAAALVLAAVAAAAVVPGVAAAPGAPVAPPPDGWQPAAWRSLGDGRYDATLAGTRLLEALAVRDGAWSLQLLRARDLRPPPAGAPAGGAPAGGAPAGGAPAGGAAVAVARALGDLTVAAAWVAGEGPGAGLAVDVAARGEAWAWWTVGGGWRLGGELIVVDGVRAGVTWWPRGGTLGGEVRAALPLWPEEGRPVSLALGYGRPTAAPDPAAYARLAARVGANELGVVLDAHGRVATTLTLRW